jgi:hypothetical protein
MASVSVSVSRGVSRRRGPWDFMKRHDGIATAYQLPALACFGDMAVKSGMGEARIDVQTSGVSCGRDR